MREYYGRKSSIELSSAAITFSVVCLKEVAEWGTRQRDKTRRILQSKWKRLEDGRRFGSVVYLLIAYWWAQFKFLKAKKQKSKKRIAEYLYANVIKWHRNVAGATRMPNEMWTTTNDVCKQQIAFASNQYFYLSVAIAVKREEKQLKCG